MKVIVIYYLLKKNEQFSNIDLVLNQFSFAKTTKGVIIIHMQLKSQFSIA